MNKRLIVDFTKKNLGLGMNDPLYLVADVPESIKKFTAGIEKVLRESGIQDEIIVNKRFEIDSIVWEIEEEGEFSYRQVAGKEVNQIVHNYWKSHDWVVIKSREQRFVEWQERNSDLNTGNKDQQYIDYLIVTLCTVSGFQFEILKYQFSRFPSGRKYIFWLEDTRMELPEMQEEEAILYLTGLIDAFEQIGKFIKLNSLEEFGSRLKEKEQSE